MFVPYRTRGTMAMMTIGRTAKKGLDGIRRLLPAVRRVWNWVPWTWRAVVLAVVVWFAIRVYGLDKLDLVLLVIGGAAAGLLIISTLVVVVGALVVRVQMRRAVAAKRGRDDGGSDARAMFETSTESPTGFSIRSLRWVPLLQVDWSWISIAARVRTAPKSGRLQEHVAPTRRGKHSMVVREVTVQDAFRLARITQRFEDDYGFDVLPHVGGLRRLPVLTSFAGGDEVPHPMGLDDGDRVELRRYVPGDPARFIHWKVFGRTRQLMVRVPERALARSRRTVAYLVAGENDEASAAAARVAIEGDALGVEWRFGADGTNGATSDHAEAVQKILQSAGVGADPSRGHGAGLKAFVDEVDRDGPAALVVFAPPASGSWVNALRRVAARRTGVVRVVIAVDGLVERPRPGRLAGLFLQPLRLESAIRSEVDDLAQALRDIRCELILLDRVSGRAMSGSGRAASPQRSAA